MYCTHTDCTHWWYSLNFKRRRLNSKIENKRFYYFFNIYNFVIYRQHVCIGIILSVTSDVSNWKLLKWKFLTVRRFQKIIVSILFIIYPLILIRQKRLHSLTMIYVKCATIIHIYKPLIVYKYAHADYILYKLISL